MNDLPNKELLLICEVARYYSKSDRTIRRWIKRGEFKTVKKGGSVFIKHESVSTPTQKAIMS